ncbi:Uncharacterised protein [Sphingobacterium daejeonense]|nr:Uncharacterised protein [Sphingobacterium daejeonense]
MQCHCITFLLTLQKNMKVFFSILAIYMMAVFLMPCTDIYEKESFQNHNHSEELAIKQATTIRKNLICAVRFVYAVVVEWCRA